MIPPPSVVWRLKPLWAAQFGCSTSVAWGCPWYTFSSGPEVPAMMGQALVFVCLALPWSSGTGGTSFLGWVCVQSGRAMPFFAIKITSGTVCPELEGVANEKTDRRAEAKIHARLKNKTEPDLFFGFVSCAAS